VNGATPKGKAEVVGQPALVGVEKTVDFRLADLLFLYFSFGQMTPISLPDRFSGP
jgi:hypothetical protein